MLAALAQPWALGAVLVWNFAVLSAAQLTIRLIMAFSVRTTAVGAVLLTVGALLVAAVYDGVVSLAVGPQPSLATRLAWAPLPMLLTGLAGFVIARRALRIRRLRGQIVAAVMIGLLDPHVFTLLFP